MRQIKLRQLHSPFQWTLKKEGNELSSCVVYSPLTISTVPSPGSPFFCLLGRLQALYLYEAPVSNAESDLRSISTPIKDVYCSDCVSFYIHMRGRLSFSRKHEGPLYSGHTG